MDDGLPKIVIWTTAARVIIPVTFGTTLITIVILILYPGVVWMIAASVAAAIVLPVSVSMSIRWGNWRLYRRDRIAEISHKEAVAERAWNESNIIVVDKDKTPWRSDEYIALSGSVDDPLPADVMLNIWHKEEQTGQTIGGNRFALPNGVTLDMFINWCARAKLGFLQEEDYAGSGLPFTGKQYRALLTLMAEAGICYKNGTHKTAKWVLTRSGKAALTEWSAHPPPPPGDM